MCDPCCCRCQVFGEHKLDILGIAYRHVRSGSKGGPKSRMLYVDFGGLTPHTCHAAITYLTLSLRSVVRSPSFCSCLTDSCCANPCALRFFILLVSCCSFPCVGFRNGGENGVTIKNCKWLSRPGEPANAALERVLEVGPAHSCL